MTASPTPTPPLRGEFHTLGQAFVAAAAQFGDRDAYVEGPARLSFGEWLERSQRVAGRWRRLGVGPGDVVAILVPPSIDYAIAVGAAALLGSVATGINTRLGPQEVSAILDLAPPALLVADPAADHLIPAGVAVMGRQELVEAAGSEPSAPAPPQDGMALEGLALTDPTLEGPSPDPAVIIWTSGTTGTPKGAWFDHAALKAAVTTAGVMSAPFDRRLVSTPFAHAGYMAKVWEQLAWGVCLVISPQPWRAQDMLALIVAERITVAGGVPTQWAKLLEIADVDSADLSALRLCVSATAPAPPELVARVVERLSCPLVVRYAMTESPSITGTDPDDPPEIQYRTVGRPQAGVEIELRDEQGGPVPAGQTGRVHIRSTCAMRGYWNAPELTTASFDVDGWLRSGDLGHLDPHGNLVLDGRADDMYIRGGYNVYPLEVENVLDEHPGVSQASVVGSPAPVIGQIGIAFVRPADPAHPPSGAELVAWCKARLADYKAPDRVVVVDELPLTSMMKVDKAALRDLAKAVASEPR